MKKLDQIQKDKLKIILELLAEDSPSWEKIKKVGELGKGINPEIDKKLEPVLVIVDKIKKISGGEVIELALDKLPGKTDKDKKRKKLLLLLLTSVKDLKSEINRVGSVSLAGGEIAKTEAIKTAKILATVKGPLGIITIAAAGIVAVTNIVNSMAVEVAIKNNGCQPIQPMIERMVNLPGLKLPSTSIASGQEGKAVILPLSFLVDMTEPYQVSISMSKWAKSFEMPGEIREVIYDGQSLMGQKTQVELGKTKSHSLEIKCR